MKKNYIQPSVSATCLTASHLLLGSAPTPPATMTVGISTAATTFSGAAPARAGGRYL